MRELCEPADSVRVLAYAEANRTFDMHLVGTNVFELVHEGVLTSRLAVPLTTWPASAVRAHRCRKLSTTLPWP